MTTTKQIMYYGKLLLVLLLSYSAKSVTAAEIVRFGQFEMEYFPFQYLQKGRYIGTDRDMITEAFRRLPDYELRIEVVPVARAYQSLKRGSVDIMYSYDIEKHYSYSYLTTTPIRWMQFRFAVMPGKGFVFNKIEDLYGKRFGLIKHGYINSRLAKAEAQGHVEFQPLPGLMPLLEMLRRGRIDSFYGNGAIFAGAAQLEDVEIEFLPKTLGPKLGFYVSISKAAGVADPLDLHRQLSMVIKEMHEDGTDLAIFQRRNVKHVDVLQPD